ncbi:MAG TPA: lysophospholipid acyltransferase family protein [Gemmatimonadales bacterium]|nr:lysophospholipid acyltransferase family protein [Gemmatimonadales bacterium]
MIALATIRFALSTLVLTLWHAVRVILASLAGVRHQSGHYDRIVRSWARQLVGVNRLRVAAVGLERLDPAAPYVLVSNHTSFVDIWALLVTLPGAIRFIAKRELLWIPVFGWALRSAGHIAIDRRDLRDAMAGYDEAARAIRAGVSALVFVEGTRSRTGELLDFKKGAFVLAIAAGVPVVPVYIDGAFRVLPRGSLVFRPGPVRVLVGEPIPTAGLGYEDRDVLRERARRAMLALRDRAGAGREAAAPAGAGARG